MNPNQLVLFIALAVIGVSLIASISVLALAFHRYREQQAAERSLLNRLEEASKQIQPARAKVNHWSQM